jgi:hypothetical protein
MSGEIYRDFCICGQPRAGGVTLQDVVFRCIYSAHNADYQTRGGLLGRLDPLRPAEIELIAANLSRAGQARAWDDWLSRLRKAGGMPAPSRVGAGQAPLL